MPENYEHYISNNIKEFYKRRLIAPILYLLLLIVLWFLFSLGDPLFPDSLTAKDTLESAYKEDIEYVHISLTDLKFTGYTKTFMGSVTGYYYYTMRGDECIIVLLSPDISEQGLPTITHANFNAKIVDGSDNFELLLNNLASDLNWTENGIRNKVSHYVLSETDYNMAANLLLYLVVFGTGAYALICLVLFILYISFPVLSPPCQDLALFGNPKELLEQAEEELATLPQLATEDMFITEHFFIATSVAGSAIIPIKEIVWIYKYSTLHKFLWYHFSISYTLHITANRHLYIRCPQNIKSDIDGIIDYLSEANHDILVGFSEANRLKVQEAQGSPMHIKKIIAFLNKKI